MSLVSSALPARLAPSSPVGLHRVLEPAGRCRRPRPGSTPRRSCGRTRYGCASTAQLDAASNVSCARLMAARRSIRSEVLEIISEADKMHNPSPARRLLVGVVEEVVPQSPLGLRWARVATLVSLTLTPLVVTDELRSWGGRSEQVRRPFTPCCSLFRGAVLPRIAAPWRCACSTCAARPPWRPRRAVLRGRGRRPSVLVLGGAGKVAHSRGCGPHRGCGAPDRSGAHGVRGACAAERRDADPSSRDARDPVGRRQQWGHPPT